MVLEINVCRSQTSVAHIITLPSFGKISGVNGLGRSYTGPGVIAGPAQSDILRR
jgi:hypothetical protein